MDSTKKKESMRKNSKVSLSKKLLNNVSSLDFEKLDSFNWTDFFDREIFKSYAYTPSDYFGASSIVLGEFAIRKNVKLKLINDNRWLRSGSIDKVLSVLKSLDAKIVISNIRRLMKEDVYVWPLGVAMIEYRFFNHDNVNKDDDEVDISSSVGNEYITFSMLSFDDTCEKINDIMINNAPLAELPDPPAGRAYVLCETQRGVNIVSIGLGGQELERSNYSKEVLTSYDKAISDFNSSKPKGRLTILDGPPGSGKTFMVRAIMHEVKESKFVVVPPHMVKNLADPNLIMSFINELRDDSTPLILILEDADQCLAKRKTDNMASISAILNLSDGIIGGLLDLRILATTNTPAAEFDEALLRKGRISSHIKIGKINKNQVSNVWKRLAGDRVELPHELNDATVIANVYAAYNELSELEKVMGDIDKLKQ